MEFHSGAGIYVPDFHSTPSCRDIKRRQDRSGERLSSSPFAEFGTRGSSCGLLMSVYCDVTITPLFDEQVDCDVRMKKVCGTGAMSGIRRNVNIEVKKWIKSYRNILF